MKTYRLLGGLLLALVGAGAVRALDTAKGPAQVEVVFFEREKFADAKDDFQGSERGRDDILDRLKDHLAKEGLRGLKPGQRLAVTITEVDLAGDFEPWRGSQWMDVRIVKDIYPPRIDLTFKLMAADGAVVKEGKRELRDLNFMWGMTHAFRDDSLKYEKELLDTWVRTEFRAEGKGKGEPKG